MSKHVHIVAFDIPYPDDYGGVIEIYHTLKTLQALGWSIHLHCFAYGRAQAPELEAICHEVYYYPRTTGHQGFSLQWPYIVSSRKNEALLQRLLQDNHPILLEGMHCSWPVIDDRFQHRKILVRAHNVESLYYQLLGRHSTQLLKKFYYSWEGRQLRPYEEKIAASAHLLAMTVQDQDYFRNKLSASQCDLLHAFHPYAQVTAQTGKGMYCLYQGNLAIPENEQAALFLLQHVFNEIDIPFVIAGRSPSKKLERWAHRQSHTCLVANPTAEEMKDMIAKAQIHILPSLSSTGIKLKLLNALFNGRHCLVNTPMVSGTGLESVCHVADEAKELQNKIRELFHQPFTDTEKLQRTTVLETQYSNLKNGEKLSTWLA